MGTPYSSVSVSGFNSSPPSDDGTQTDANKVYWATIKTKLGDPLNTALAAIDAALVTAFNYTAVTKTTDYTTVSGDSGKIIEIGSTVSSGITITIEQAATMGTSYIIKVYNASTISQTVARSASDTFNGSLTSLTLPTKCSVTLQTNSSGNGYDIIASVGFMPGSLTVTGTVNGNAAMLSPITASLAGNVALNNTGNYFTGPTVAQGTSGTWFASGTVVVLDSAGAAIFDVKLWDGTTVIAEARASTTAANQEQSVSVSGFITSPAGNLRISVRDVSSTSGQIRFNANSDGSKTATVTAIRIG